MENIEYAYRNLSVILLSYSLGRHATVLNTTSNFNTLARNYVFKPVKTKKCKEELWVMRIFQLFYNLRECHVLPYLSTNQKNGNMNMILIKKEKETLL